MAEVRDLKSVKDSIKPDIKNILVKGIKKYSQMPSNVSDCRKDISRKENENEVKTTKKEVSTSSHSEADVNWATIVNKITVPNVVKSGLTLGGGYIGSLLGAGLATGIGLVIGGPAGAVVGYNIGNLVGFGGGVCGGHKFGKAVANELEDKKRENIINTGTTRINVDTTTKVDIEKRTGNDERI